MPVNGMNTGSDYSISYYDTASGVVVDLGDIQSVTITAAKHDIKSQPYNRPPRFGYVHDGFRVTFAITRTGPEIEDFMVQAAENFNAGRISTSGFLNQTINNPDGSVSRYQYTGFVMFLTDHGDVSREKTVTLRLEGLASEKRRIA